MSNSFDPDFNAWNQFGSMVPGCLKAENSATRDRKKKDDFCNGQVSAQINDFGRRKGRTHTFVCSAFSHGLLNGGFTGLGFHRFQKLWRDSPWAGHWRRSLLRNVGSWNLFSHLISKTFFYTLAFNQNLSRYGLRNSQRT